MEIPISSEVIQFDGPPIFAVLDHRYVTLTSGGIKPEGEVALMFDSALEAWGRYMIELAAFTRNAQQIAWRWRPELREEKGAFTVYSRLYAHKFEG